MPFGPSRLRVAVNVMRARLTILGFNLAIITFQINNVAVLAGGIDLPGFERTVHLSAGAVLLLGVALSIAAMVAFINSTALDREGTCDHWSLLAGHLLMYLALAQTVTGFFSPYQFVLRGQAALTAVRAAMTVSGAAAWAMATYLGPAVSLLRSPFGRRTTSALGLAYLILLLLVSRTWTLTLQQERADIANEGAVSSWLGDLVAPFLW